MKLVLASLALAIGVMPAMANENSAAKKRLQHPKYRASGPADPSFDVMAVPTGPQFRALA